MPAICINPVDSSDAELIRRLNEQNQDIRLFISDRTDKQITESLVGKKAIGDINDDSHISTASSGAYCGIFFEYDNNVQREIFLEVIKNSALQRIIWVSAYQPTDEITSIANLIYIYYENKKSAHDVILDFEGRDAVKSEFINLVN
tara:strand:+ start:751 stop:1188 length:438 start_codon:yes stop_codon:yes gene_type:complete